jgi:hypothetical protein
MDKKKVSNPQNPQDPVTNKPVWWWLASAIPGTQLIKVGLWFEANLKKHETLSEKKH